MSARIYLIKKAFDDGLAQLKELGQTTGVAFPDESAEARRARTTLMDLGPKGVALPREKVVKYLTEHAPKYTPWDEYTGRGAMLGAGVATLPRLKEIYKMMTRKPGKRGVGSVNKKTIASIIGQALGGAVGGGGLGAYMRYRSQRRTGEKAVDEYNQLQLKKMYG